METLKGRIRLILIFMLLAGGASGKVAPEFERRSIITPHFRIHYPPQYKKFSEILASKLEEAYVLLAKDFSWHPESKTEVLVRGDIDSPNGFAEVFPYNRLVFHAVPPEPWGFFSESDDWIRTLVIHELTHIIANDETSGLFRFLRSIIGTAAKVNPYQPNWLIEGLAVYEETRLTSGGRGRSVWNAMVVRKAAEENLFQAGGEITLDRLNDGIPFWPAGHTPYLFGYLLIDEVARLGGSTAPFKISSLNSSYLPFAIEGVALDTLGFGYSDIWKNIVDRLALTTRTDLAELKSLPLSPLKTFTTSGRRTRGYAETKDGALFIRDSKRDGVGLTYLREGKTKNLNLWRFDGGTRVRATPDRMGAGYSKITPFREHSLFSELFYYDMELDRETQLTQGSRGADPDFSSDFKWDSERNKISQGKIVFIKNQPDGNQALVLFNGETEEVVYSGDDFQRISTPVFGSEKNSERILFSEKSRTLGEKIRVLDLRTLEVQDLTQPSLVNESAITPEWDNDGSVLFSKGKNGVFNIYRIREDRITRVTHTTGGFIQPTVVRGHDASKKIISMNYGKSGFDLSEVELALDLGSTLVLAPDKTQVGVSVADSPTAILPSSYSVFPSLFPKYWAPDIRRVPEGWTLGVQTSNFDPWEAHRYRLFAGGDNRADFPIWNFNYQYDGLFPTLELSFHQENKYFETYGESNRIRTGEINVSVPAGWDSNFILGATTTVSRFFSGEESTGGFQFGWNYRRLQAFDDSIDREGEVGVSFETILNGNFSEKEKFTSVNSYLEFRIPSPIQRHFIKFSTEYGRSNNSRIEAMYFLGGGEETIANTRQFLLRGYESGSIFGREILTSNLEYQFPVVDIFRGLSTWPIYFERARMKFVLDVGSAEYIGRDQGNFQRWPLGAGIHFLNDFNLLYRVPVTMAVGFDRGFSESYGGESRVVFGLFSKMK